MKPNFDKYMDGLVPAIVQDHLTGTVLMLGYMNEEAWVKTLETEMVTFYSRSKSRLWTKGETSGHVLRVKKIFADCDKDCLLILAEPNGPVCHTGSRTCFGEEGSSFLIHLENTIDDRIRNPDAQSYTSALFARGLSGVAQKVGEEAVELVIESILNDDEKFLNEAADLLYHFLVLLRCKGMNLKHVLSVLEKRHHSRTTDDNS